MVDQARTFTYNSIIALIRSVEMHIEDFNHLIKRKHVFNNIANELVSVGHSVTPLQCKSKWKSLVRSYRIVKDNKLQTGRGPLRFNFYSEMDSILGDKPSSNCSHALDTGNMSNVEELEIPTSSNSKSELPTTSGHMKIMNFKSPNNQGEEVHTFTYKSTIALIQSMETHIEDLNHIIKRKHVYNNIVNDMESMGYIVTPLQCSNKWKCLVRRYRLAKHNKSGTSPCKFSFYSEMDSILGDKSSSSCSHMLDSGNMAEPEEEPEIPTSSDTTSHTQTISENMKISNIKSSLHNQIEESRTFTYNATLALIQTMESYIEEWNNGMKRKAIFNNIANNMVSMGYTVTPCECHNKWRSLIRTYRMVKETQSKTGRVSCRFNFYSEMDSILGDMSSYSSSHTFGTGNIAKSKEESGILTNSNTKCEPPSKKRKQSQPTEHLNKFLDENEKYKVAHHKDQMDIEKVALHADAPVGQLEEVFIKTEHKNTLPDDPSVAHTGDTTSKSIDSKLETLPNTQKMYAEILIQAVLTKGLLNQLTANTRICDLFHSDTPYTPIKTAPVISGVDSSEYPSDIAIKEEKIDIHEENMDIKVENMYVIEEKFS